MRNWGAELKFRNEVFEMRIEKLLNDHAQSSPEDLMKMSYKFQALLDSMEEHASFGSSHAEYF